MEGEAVAAAARDDAEGFSAADKSLGIFADGAVAADCHYYVCIAVSGDFGGLSAAGCLNYFIPEAGFVYQLVYERDYPVFVLASGYRIDYK